MAMLKAILKFIHHDVHDIQNEILEAMARKILLENIQEIRNADLFSILLDGSADIARTEEIPICFRADSSDFVALEYFMWFHSKERSKASTLFHIDKDVLACFDLLLSKLRGQCYNSAANVSRTISEFQQKIKEESRTLTIHCNAHNLNFAVQYGVEKVLEARKFIGEVKELINFVRDSPTWVAQFQGLQEKEQSDSKVPALVAYHPIR